MLNISPNSIDGHIHRERYVSLRLVDGLKSGKVLKRMLLAFSLVALVILFVPWTQNIRTQGQVTTLRPEHRPQTVNSIIAGRIEEWFVREGDPVNKGDTIMFISEIKDDYFDPELLTRTDQQLKAKESSVDSYMAKVKALDNQIDALSRSSLLKLEQAKNKLEQVKLKIATDSLAVKAAVLNASIAQEQLLRMEEMYAEGLKSLTDFEKRKTDYQKNEAELLEKRNKLLTTRNELLNAEVELISVTANYQDKIAKAESEKASAMSNMFDAEAQVTKLQNQYMNYSVRRGMYYITSPINGYITRTIQTGIGETIKEGAEILTIMPKEYQLSVEMFIRPVDLPLMETGQPVRIQFDGWPAIIFSGWPNTSYGTYGGTVFAIDNFISDNGKYRILVQQDPNDHEWPDALRVGGGTNSMILLKDVPIWYELWRQINGFPPDYYKQGNSSKSDKKEK